MATPDISPYVSLNIFDTDPQTVITHALTQLQTDLPDWSAREGNTEMLVLEAVGLEVSELIFAINRLPAGIVQALLLLYGIQPSIGSLPTATVTFTANDTAGHDVPAGTRVRLNFSYTLASPIIFSTTAAASVPAGATTITVPVIGDSFTDAGNSTAVGTVLDILDTLTSFDSAALATIPLGGANPEDSTAYLNRGMARFQRLSDALVLPSHFTAAALEDPDVSRAFTIDNWDTVGIPGAVGGHVTVAVYGQNGLLDGPTKAALAAAMNARSVSNLVVHVIDPTITVVNLTALVVALPGYDPTSAAAAATAAATTWLSSQTWGWDAVVRRNAAFGILSAAPGVSYVDNISVPSGDQALPGNANITAPGTITITGRVGP